MSEEQLKSWFWNIFLSCYPVKHDEMPDIVYMIYDKNLLRKKVINTILGKDIQYPKEIKGDCLFELNYKRNILWCDINKVFEFLRRNTSDPYNSYDYRDHVSKWISEYVDLNIFTTMFISLSNRDKLFDSEKLKMLKPMFKDFSLCPLKIKTNKIKIYE
jgi:hypothetical protein